MRILSLGIGLPNSQVDNYNWASALSFYDYDVMIVDPAEAVSNMIESTLRDGGGYQSYNQEPVEDGPTTPTSAGLADLLRRRRDEVEKLLARGGLIVCFAHPDLAHTRVSGFTGCHRYYWLPAPQGLDYSERYLATAGGTSLTIEDSSSPFADFLERFRSNILYRAAFQEEDGGFLASGKVLARSPGGAVVALELEIGGGRVVFLPALPPNLGTSERMGVATSLVTGVRNTLLLSAEGASPTWIDRYPLPGIVEARAEIDAANQQLDDADASLLEARNKYRGIDRYRRVLWQEGKYGYDLPVRDALELLGMISIRHPDDPAVFSYDGQQLMVETESDAGAVGMSPHYRLRQRLEAKIVADRSVARGVIVLNGFREQDPDSRPVQYEDSLKLAAETLGYCLLEARQLFDAVKAKLEERDDGKAFCEALLTTRGVFEPPPSPEPGPLTAEENVGELNQQ